QRNKNVYAPGVAIVLGDLKRLARLGALQQLREALDSSDGRALLPGCLGHRELLATSLSPSHSGHSGEDPFAIFETWRLARTLPVNSFPAAPCCSFRCGSAAASLSHFDFSS